MTPFNLLFQSIPEDRLEKDPSRDRVTPEKEDLVLGIVAGSAAGLKPNVIRSGSSRKTQPPGEEEACVGGKMTRYGAQAQTHRASSLEHLLTRYLCQVTYAGSSVFRLDWINRLFQFCLGQLNCMS